MVLCGNVLLWNGWICGLNKFIRDYGALLHFFAKITYAKNTAKHIIPEKSDSGMMWENFSFEEFANWWKIKGEPYEIDVKKIMKNLKEAGIKTVGKRKGKHIFYKSLLWDMVFNRPKWMPEEFNIDLYYRFYSIRKNKPNERWKEESLNVYSTL